MASDLPYSRITYCLLFTLEIVIIWLFRDIISESLSVTDFPEVFDCTTKECLKTNSILRLSFGYATFHFIMAFMFIPTKSNRPFQWQLKLQYGLWWLKLPAIVGLSVVTFVFIPKVVLWIYGWFSVAASGIFLFIQVIILVDIAYTLNDKWSDSAISSISDSFSLRAIQATRILITSTTVLAYLVSIMGFIGAYLIYVFATPQNSSIDSHLKNITFSWDRLPYCVTNFSVITETVVACLIITIISSLEQIERGSLFAASFVSVYSMLMVWTALAGARGDCSSTLTELSHVAVITVSAIIALMVITYSGLYYFVAPRGQDKAKKKLLDSEHQYPTSASNSQIFLPPGPIEKPTSAGDIFSLSSREMKQPYSYSRFHLVFAFAGAYLGMTFTAWDFDHETINDDGLTYWIKITVQLLTFLLYTWSLIAPLVLKFCKDTYGDVLLSDDEGYDEDVQQETIREDRSESSFRKSGAYSITDDEQFLPQ